MSKDPIKQRWCYDGEDEADEKQHGSHEARDCVWVAIWFLQVIHIIVSHKPWIYKNEDTYEDLSCQNGESGHSEVNVSESVPVIICN